MNTHPTCHRRGVGPSPFSNGQPPSRTASWVGGGTSRGSGTGTGTPPPPPHRLRLSSPPPVCSRPPGTRRRRLRRPRRRAYSGAAEGCVASGGGRAVSRLAIVASSHIRMRMRVGERARQAEESRRGNPLLKNRLSVDLICRFFSTANEKRLSTK